MNYTHTYEGYRAVKVADSTVSHHILVKLEGVTNHLLIPKDAWGNSAVRLKDVPNLDEYTWMSQADEKRGDYLIYSPPMYPNSWHIIRDGTPAPGYMICRLPQAPDGTIK